MLNLGTQTGSLTNYIYSWMLSHSPEQATVGDGATILMWTDRYAGTVLKKFTKGKSAYVEIQEDHATPCGDNEYRYSRDTQGRIWTFRYDPSKDQWRCVEKQPSGRYKLTNSQPGVAFKIRTKFHDNSF